MWQHRPQNVELGVRNLGRRKSSLFKSRLKVILQQFIDLEFLTRLSTKTRLKIVLTLIHYSIFGAISALRSTSGCVHGPAKIKLREFQLKIYDWDQSPHQHEQRNKVKQMLYIPCPEDPLRQQDTESWERYRIHHSRSDLDKYSGFRYRIFWVIHFAKSVD